MCPFGRHAIGFLSDGVVFEVLLTKLTESWKGMKFRLLGHFAAGKNKSPDFALTGMRRQREDPFFQELNCSFDLASAVLGLPLRFRFQ